MAAHAMKRADDCPGLEMLAAYLDDRLSTTDRRAVAAHLADCETCYFVFAEAAQIRRAQGIGQPTEPEPLRARSFVPAWFGPRVAWSVGGVLAAAAVLVLAVGSGRLFWRTEDSDELRALVVAVGTDRVVEPRLTGGFAFGLLRAPVRAGGSAAQAVSPDVRIAAAQIEKTASTRRTATTLRDLGVARLVSGDVTRAVSTLEEAASLAPTDARMLSDLAAAYLERGRQTGERQDLMKALGAAERAVGSNPRLAEAWFNRADALERLSLAPEARDAWRDYLTIDARSPWASEARSRLTRLEAPPASGGK